LTKATLAEYKRQLTELQADDNDDETDGNPYRAAKQSYTLDLASATMLESLFASVDTLFDSLTADAFRFACMLCLIHIV
jgi:hypothetical protein